MGDSSVEYHVSCGDDIHIKTPKKLADWKNFDDFCENGFALYKIIIVGENWKSGKCTCPAILKYWLCKHLVGLALIL